MKQKTHKPFIYLVNARQALAKNFFHLQKENSDCIIVTWDKPLAGCLYFPDSIWSKARNLLLQKAKEQAQSNDYEYYVFLDDDVSFLTGSFEQFESALLRHQPKVAGTRYVRQPPPGGGWNTFKAFLTPLWDRVCCFPSRLDLCIIAHHKDVVRQGVLLPYDESVDEENILTSSRVFHYLMRALYPKHSLYFRNFTVLNEMTRIGTEGEEGGYIKSAEDRRKLTRHVYGHFAHYTHLSSVELAKLVNETPTAKRARDGYTLANLLQNYCEYLAYRVYYRRKAPRSGENTFKPNYFDYKQELMRARYTYQDLRQS